MSYNGIVSKEDWDLVNSIESVHIPEKWRLSISDEFVYDYDILYVDERVKSELMKEKVYEVSALKMRFFLYMTRLNGKHDRVTYGKIVSDIYEMIDKIKDIMSDNRILSYIEESSQYIEAYKMLDDQVNYEVDFIADIAGESNIVSPRRVKIINDYIEVAKKYIDIDVSKRPQNNNDTCTSCGMSIENLHPSDEGIITCTNCNTFNRASGMNRGKKEHPSTLIITSDESIENFRKALMYYQCKCVKIPEEDRLWARLDEHFKSIFKDIGEVVKLRPLDKWGIRRGTSHVMLYDALQKIGAPGYYKYANYIGHKYWGWAVRDVSEHEDTIFRHYAKIQLAYNKIPISIRERTSSPGTNFRLFKQLEIVGHMCRMKEFKIAENDKSFGLHLEIWEMTIKICNDPEIPFIESNKVTVDNISSSFSTVSTSVW